MGLTFKLLHNYAAGVASIVSKIVRGHAGQDYEWTTVCIFVP